MITGSESSLCALNATLHGPWPFVVCREARSIQLSGYPCVESVPLEIKWACTCETDGEVFPCVQMCRWSTVCDVVVWVGGVVCSCCFVCSCVLSSP